MDRLTQVQNYFDGKLSKKEAEEFLQWFLSESSEEEVHAELDKLWYAKGKGEYDWKGDTLYQQILKKKDNQRTLNVSRKSKPEVAEGMKWWKIAAAVALLIVSSFLLYTGGVFTSSPTDFTEIVKSNPAGQKSKVYLPDGTIVNLNSESSITYTDEFAEGRKVYLKGEAFFDVTEDPSKPFTVYSGKLATTALGTSFNIKSYNKRQTEVVLVTGKVKVEKADSKELVYLVPGERASIDENQTTILKDQTDLKSITYWKEGVLHFDRSEIDHVVETLERWYGVEIETTGSLPDVKCSGTFQKNEYLTNVLEILSHSVGFEYTLNGKNLKLDFNQK
ncbi:MAG: DUF4974 domain-containing protein [Marinoscillum sp.]